MKLNIPKKIPAKVTDSLEEQYLQSLRRKKVSDKFEKEKFISEMKVGESGYTVPWSLGIDEQGYAWINGNYSISHNSGGTCQLKVERTAKGYVATCMDEYARSKELSRGSAGFNGWSNIPLIELKWS